MDIEPKLSGILACPNCKGGVSLSETKDGIICFKCKLIYPIEDEIPVMVIGAAKKLD